VPSIVELSYEHAVRALDLQERGVEQLRNRAGIVLAAASVTASFLGAQTIQHTSGLGVLEVLALVSLAGSICFSVYVLLPKRGFVFSLNAVRAYERLYEKADDEAQIELVFWLESYWKGNQSKIDALGQYFFAAAVALVAQFAFWSWALADRIA
jgi:hypothetical protein